MSSEIPSNSSIALTAPSHIHTLLNRLHALSLSQESTLPPFLRSELTDTKAFDELMRDKFIALEQPKCLFVYTLLRALNARHVVEIGTSYGVSTIYLALAVSQNFPGGDGKVIGTEYEKGKAEKARVHWKEAGDDVSGVIELREGDLRETLKCDLPDQIDFVLLDIWAPMALPALKLLQGNLRKGAVIVTDNTVGAAKRYEELLRILRDPEGPFRSVVIPYHNGLELSVYLL